MAEIENSDESIVTSVKHGNIEAFGDLVVRYEDKLKRYGRKFLSQKEDIEDLVQEVFIKAYTNIQSFDTELRFSPWLYRIAHNTFVNELKRKSRFGSLAFETDTILPQLLARETADAPVLEIELKEEMEKHLEKLPAKYREVLILHYFEDFSYQETSDILKIPVTTVGVRIMRARDKLKQSLTETYE